MCVRLKRCAGQPLKCKRVWRIMDGDYPLCEWRFLCCCVSSYTSEGLQMSVLTLSVNNIITNRLAAAYVYQLTVSKTNRRPHSLTPSALRCGFSHLTHVMSAGACYTAVCQTSMSHPPPANGQDIIVLATHNYALRVVQKESESVQKARTTSADPCPQWVWCTQCG